MTDVSYYSNVFKSYLEYLKDYFKIIKVEYYNSENENNLSFKINTYGKSTKKTSSIVLTSSQLDKPSIQKYNNFSKNLKVKVNGC